MTEQQLRDVLARVVPEPPDSVADAAPVIRVARRGRQVRVAGVTALAAVLVAGAVLGVRTFGADDRQLVADPPAIPDPYTTAPCPDAQQPWDVAPLTDLSAVTAVRFCARDLNGFDGAEGPRDALVVDIGSFADAVRALEPADPSRCAAVDVIPTDNRILFQLADGTVSGVPGGFCQDAEIEGRTLDGNGLTTAFLGALAAQRAEHDYAPATAEPATCAVGLSDISPAQPRNDHLVAAVVCGPNHPDRPVELGVDQLAALQTAWDSADDVDDVNVTCDSANGTGQRLFVRTDHGDNIQLDASCGYVTYYASNGNLYRLDLRVDQLLS